MYSWITFFSFLFEFYHDVNKCLVVLRRHEYSDLINNIMSMILPYDDTLPKLGHKQVTSSSE